MANKKDGGYAFPLPIVTDENNGIQDTTDYCSANGGMSLRDYFAGQALIGDLSGENEFTGITTENNNGTRAENLAVRAYGVADAMIKERDK